MPKTPVAGTARSSPYSEPGPSRTSSSGFKTPNKSIEHRRSGKGKLDKKSHSFTELQSDEEPSEVMQVVGDDLDHQLYAEDLVDPENKLMLVKIPPGVDMTSLIGKTISTKKTLSAQIRKPGGNSKVNLNVDMQDSNEELNKWSVFLPSKTDGEYRFVNRVLEGSVTLSYTVPDAGEETWGNSSRSDDGEE